MFQSPYATVRHYAKKKKKKKIYKEKKDPVPQLDTRVSNMHINEVLKHCKFT